MQYAFVALDNAPYRTGVAVSLLQKHEPILLVADAFDTSRANQFLSYIDCRLFKATVLETRRLRNQLHGESIEDMRYALAQIGLTIFAAYIDTEKNMRSLLRWIPKLILITIEEIVLQIPIMVARVVGMLTFHWRRLVW